jgi:hypothetical protein
MAGEQIAAANVLIFIGALIIGQLASAWVMTLDPMPKYLKYVAMAFIVALAIVLIVYTYNPFHAQISIDTAAGVFGLP